ncbi:MAG: type II toxin-antitoxin system death-on-curing family toxin [Nitrospinae bacterium CG11_big_fil_rev_8_21_14_0_20_56_8]|nr:MAG: type II toxin-antitoxin system death-on-curing family toxin [Nitrospinae bacterium CG11_big_fil_rev_8_21_14_0_20_56_8]
MKKEPVWVLKSVVLAMHEEQLLEHGGQPGLRDDHLLESALARPQQLFSYDDPDLFDLAAAYVQGIVRNHPFLDGNKRTAFLTGYVFLARNGMLLQAPEAEAAQVMLNLASRKIKEEEFAAWLKKNSAKKKSPRGPAGG